MDILDNVKTNISAAILCGGRSSRMGEDKAKLPVGNTNGDTFVQSLVRNLSPIDDLWLSIGTEGNYPEIAVRKVSDRQPGAGPLGGLESALTICRNECLFVVPVDMPFADAMLVSELCTFMDRDCDALLIVDEENRKQPFPGIYKKQILPGLSKYLAEKRREADTLCRHSDKKLSVKNRKYRVGDFLETIRTKYVPVSLLTDGKHKLLSCNTKEEYRNRILEGKPDVSYPPVPVLSFTGWSGSGKTTFLEHLIPCLKRRGLSVAYLKHDAHHFEVDREGKDSYRITRAGADMTGLFSSDKGVWMENRPVDLKRMLHYIHDVDLIILEGGSQAPYPKVLVYRESLGKGMRTDPESCFAVISDDPVSGAALQFGTHEYEKAADCILKETIRI